MDFQETVLSFLKAREEQPIREKKTYSCGSVDRNRLSN
jgi:hypothetical protein